MIRSLLLASVKGLVHGFTEAVDAGGKPLSLGSGEPETTWARAAADVGVDWGVARLSQVHGRSVIEAGVPGLQGEGDALLTRRTGLLVCVRVADCVPILVAGQGAVAAIHAGWRGLAAGVIPAALERLEGPLRAAVGPCMCVHCYETGSEVVDAIAATVPREVVAFDGPHKLHTDLKAAAAWQLQQHPSMVAVDVLPHCTSCTPGLHSFRRDGEASGRLGALVGRRPTEQVAPVEV